MIYPGYLQILRQFHRLGLPQGVLLPSPPPGWLRPPPEDGEPLCEPLCGASLRRPPARGRRASLRSLSLEISRIFQNIAGISPPDPPRGILLPNPRPQQSRLHPPLRIPGISLDFAGVSTLGAPGSLAVQGRGAEPAWESLGGDSGGERPGKVQVVKLQQNFEISRISFNFA